jgi:type VI secretion system protein ImpA
MGHNFLTHPELEFDSRYSEIDFALARLDANDDPLNVEFQESISWSQINDQCQHLLLTGFDWRVLLWQLRARMHLQGCSAFWVCLATIEQAFASLPEDDEARHQAATGLGWLAGTQCLSTFKNARLSPDSLLSLEQLQQRELDEYRPTLHFSELVSAQGMADQWYRNENLPTLQEQLHNSLLMLDRIIEIANSTAEGYMLNPHGLRDYLQATLKYLQSMATSHSDEPSLSSALTIDTVPMAESKAAQGHPQNRRDAIIMLDSVLDYFAQHEPGHPAPVFIRRAQKMIGMNFAEIVEEMLPDALTTLQQFTGKS